MLSLMVYNYSMVKKVLEEKLREFLYGNSKLSEQFNVILLILNIAIFSLFILEIWYPDSTLLLITESTFGVVFLIEYLIRLKLAPRKSAYVFSFYSIIDLIVIVSLFIPNFIGNFALLRIVRIFKIFHIYKILHNKNTHIYIIEKYKETTFAILHFFVFTILMSVSVFVTQVTQNPGISNYLDALYFTIATLTTTGFGDIVPIGFSGKILSIIIMIFGITLFLNLAKKIIYSKKSYTLCKYCGLKTHDKDASHCKHCGHVIKIATHGF